MLKLLLSASLCWLGVHAGEYFETVDQGGCESVGGMVLTDTDDCIRTARKALGYTRDMYEMQTTKYPTGCSVVADHPIWRGGGHVIFNRHPQGVACGSYVQWGNSYRQMHCICAAGEEDEGSPDDKVCIDVRKRRACKALEYCNFDRKASPMCTDKDPSVKIPIKEFCEIIHVRGWCRSVDACLWTGKQCMLRSEAVCADLEKRRRCNYFKSHKGNCLNGNYCQIGVTAATCINGGSC